MDDSIEVEAPADESTSVQNDIGQDAAKGDTNPPASNNSSGAVEFEPPQASIKRLLKNTLPANAIISKDALSAITRACGIFIIYITACANDCARESKRTTISANDILAAIKVTLFFV